MSVPYSQIEVALIMAFMVIGDSEDITEGTAKVFNVDERNIAVCKVDGQLYAIDDICSHDLAPLIQGYLDGFEIECPRHGARFDVRTGDVTELPARLPIDCFKVRVVDGQIEVDI